MLKAIMRGVMPWWDAPREGGTGCLGVILAVLAVVVLAVAMVSG